MDWVGSEIIHPAVGYVVTATLAGVVGWLAKRVSEIKHRRASIKGELDEIRDTLKANTLLTCKAIIYSEIPTITLSEKIKAYAIYRSHGGNGEAYRYMTKLLDSDPDMYLEHHAGKTTS